jgi:membrane-bound metal-dependent hydrolase YbcI (DUF457 family)
MMIEKYNVLLSLLRRLQSRLLCRIPRSLYCDYICIIDINDDTTTMHYGAYYVGYSRDDYGITHSLFWDHICIIIFIYTRYILEIFIC